MGEEYLRGLRTCFLEVHRHKVFPIAENSALEDYHRATYKSAVFNTAGGLACWASLFFLNRSVLPKYLQRWLRLGFVGVAGVGLSVGLYSLVYTKIIKEPLTRLAVMYESQERNFCTELAVFPLLAEKSSEQEALTKDRNSN